MNGENIPAWLRGLDLPRRPEPTQEEKAKLDRIIWKAKDRLDDAYQAAAAELRAEDPKVDDWTLIYVLATLAQERMVQLAANIKATRMREERK